MMGWRGRMGRMGRIGLVAGGLTLASCASHAQTPQTLNV
jgi:hypothetical protein